MTASARFVLHLPILALSAAIVSCGKKGPPLAPLHAIPGPATEVTARRVGETMAIRFKLPVANVNAPGAVDLERVEVYAVTVAPGALVPANRELLTKKYLVGSIPVRPAPVDGEPEPEAATDPRPLPGETVTFTEQLTADKLKPAPLPVETPASAAPPVADPAAEAAPPQEPIARRIYAIRGISRGGRPGQAAERVILPLTPPPPAPSDLEATFTEKTITLKWTAPAAAAEAPAAAAPDPAAGAARTLVFNVYNAADAPEGTARPLNASPLAAASFERPLTDPGTERCFVVRAAESRGAVLIEGEPSQPKCITPRDTFAPAAPAGFNGVPNPGVIDLRWNANAEPDIAGYIVLRGESPGDTLQALTPGPIRETRYSDRTVTPGVRYVYAVVAVDTATPPNTSAQSLRVEIAAR